MEDAAGTHVAGDTQQLCMRDAAVGDARCHSWGCRMLQVAVQDGRCCPASWVTRCRCSATSASPAWARLRQLPTCRWYGARSPSSSHRSVSSRHSFPPPHCRCLHQGLWQPAEANIPTSLHFPGERSPCRVPCSRCRMSFKAGSAY